MIGKIIPSIKITVLLPRKYSGSGVPLDPLMMKRKRDYCNSVLAPLESQSRALHTWKVCMEYKSSASTVITTKALVYLKVIPVSTN